MEIKILQKSFCQVIYLTYDNISFLQIYIDWLSLKLPLSKNYFTYNKMKMRLKNP